MRSLLYRDQKYDSSLRDRYLQAYQIIRSISGVGEGKGPIISIHDGFLAMDRWIPFLPNADRVAMDTHIYFAFAQTPSNSSLDVWAQQPCRAHQARMTNSLTNFGITGAGEWSLAINDCGLNVNGVGLGTRFEGTYVGNDKPAAGSCKQWLEWENWTPAIKDGLKTFAMMEMDAYQVSAATRFEVRPLTLCPNRTISSGHGGSATPRRSARRASARLSGLTSSAWRTAGCQQTPARPTASAIRLDTIARTSRG